MICPICHKKQTEMKVVKQFGNLTVEGEVCGDCFNSVSDLDAKGFYYLFYELPLKTCRACGTSFKDILNTMLVGCPYCYKEFKQELSPLIEAVQRRGER